MRVRVNRYMDRNCLCAVFFAEIVYKQIIFMNSLFFPVILFL